MDEYSYYNETVVSSTNDYIVTVYSIYTILSIVLISALAYMLFTNGKHFLNVVFKDNEPLAKAVNRLLVTGFIMFSLGYASLTVTGGSATSVAQAFETSTKKFGILLIVLAVSHLINMLILNNMRKTAEQKQLQAQSNDITNQYSEAIKNYNKQFGISEEA